jgi:hypothetical protein
MGVASNAPSRIWRRCFFVPKEPSIIEIELAGAAIGLALV